MYDNHYQDIFRTNPERNQVTIFLNFGGGGGVSHYFEVDENFVANVTMEVIQIFRGGAKPYSGRTKCPTKMI